MIDDCSPFFDDLAARTSFGKELAAVMTVRSMTQRELGRRVGVTQSAVSAWINGEVEPPPRKVIEVESELGVSPGQLSRHFGYLPLGSAEVAVDVESSVVAASIDDVAKRMLIAAYREAVTPTVGSVGRRRSRGRPGS